LACDYYSDAVGDAFYVAEDVGAKENGSAIFLDDFDGEFEELASCYGVET
jgi:hypothetical protein